MKVEFNISTEQNVREVFMLWAQKHGYEVVTSREQCPDMEVRTPDGDVKGWEIEKLASDFNRHKHDPEEADRIVCWRDDLGNAAPLPVTPLENDIEADDSLKFPKYVAAESGGKKEGWVNQLLIYQSDDGERVKIRYYKQEGGEWQQKSSATPYLSGEEFVDIFEELPAEIRREALCEASFSTLRRYVEQEIEPEAFSSSVNRSADVGKHQRDDGSTVSFGVLKSKPCFAIRGFSKNNSYRSRGAAQLHDGDFQEFFSSLEDEFAELLFVDLDVEAALDIAKQSGYPTAEELKPE